MFIFFICYQFIQIITLPFFSGYLVWRKIKKKSAFGNFFERIGIVPRDTSPRGTEIYWFHAVSVGEVISLEHIIGKIKKEKKNAICYLTVGTTTGKKMACEKLSADYVSFLPFDFLPCMLLAYKRIRPTKIFIVEAELWPNFLMIGKIKNIPMYLINARVSKRSKGRYECFKKFLLPLLRIFKKIYTQSEYDKQEFERLGIKKENIECLGNIKAYNVLKKLSHGDQQKIPTTPTLLMGSLHPGELDVYLKMYQQLKIQIPELKMIIAPRHFQWKDELIRKITETGYDFSVWETIRPEYKDILLVCKLGELFSLYAEASVFYLGGTFVPVGGHNLLEPAAWGRATIVGPYHHNCHVDVQELLKENGVLVAKDEDQLIEQTKKLFDDEATRTTLGSNANQWLTRTGMMVEEKLHFLFE